MQLQDDVESNDSDKTIELDAQTSEYEKVSLLKTGLNERWLISVNDLII